LVGVANTLIDFVLLFVLVYLGVNVLLANIIATGAAFMFSFNGNKLYTFHATGSNLVREVTLFTVVTLFGLWVLQTVVVYLLLPAIEPLVASDDLALLITKVLATGVSLVWNFVLYKYLVFREPKPVEY
jgi:putative flippase GtrA